MRFSKTFLTVDIVLFTDDILNRNVLLIKRKNNPYQNYWALPGGFVDENEDLETAALRELEEETTIKLISLKQLKAFGTPFRDPRSHVVSIAFIGIISKELHIKASDDAIEINWFSINELPKLAFDHVRYTKFCSL